MAFTPSIKTVVQGYHNTAEDGILLLKDPLKSGNSIFCLTGQKDNIMMGIRCALCMYDKTQEVMQNLLMSKIFCIEIFPPYGSYVGK